VTAVKIINLSRARKQRARVKNAAQGTQNAAKSGQTKAEKQITKHVADKAARDLDGHKRED
jgi:hypothetical protein